MAVTQKSQDNLISLAAKGLAIGGALWWGHKLYVEWQEEQQSEQLATSTPTQQAQLLRAAFNRSGVSWLGWADGTDNKTVLEVARQIRNWPEVVKAYQNLYQTNVVDELTNEFSTDELKAFYKALGKPDLIASANDFAIKYGFKYRIGDRLRSKPLTGTTTVNYFVVNPDGKGGKVLGQVAQNKVPQSIIGTIVGYRYMRVLANGKVTNERFYLVNNIPNLPINTRYYVYEKYTEKSPR